MGKRGMMHILLDLANAIVVRSQAVWLEVQAERQRRHDAEVSTWTIETMRSKSEDLGRRIQAAVDARKAAP